MMSPASLRLATLMTCGTLVVAAAIPARAGSEWQTDQMAPHWFDQTIYRPNCFPVDCACDCRSER